MLTNNSINTPALTTPGYLLIGTGTRPITGPIFGTNGIFVEFADDAIKISGSSILSGAPVDNYVAVGTGTSLTYVYVPTGQLLIGTGTRPVGAPLTAGTGIVITSSAGSITVATANSLGGTPIANYVALGTGTSLTYAYIPTGQLLIGTGTRPVGAPLTAGTGLVITSSAGSITVASTTLPGGSLLYLNTSTEQTNCTGDSTSFLVPFGTIEINTGFTYSAGSPQITILNTGTYLITLVLTVKCPGTYTGLTIWVERNRGGNIETNYLFLFNPTPITSGTNKEVRLAGTSIFQLNAADVLTPVLNGTGGAKTMSISTAGTSTDRISYMRVVRIF